MRRRPFLRGVAGCAALTGLAGCGQLLQTQPAGVPPVLDDRPDAVYVPTHVEGMEMVGMDRAGDYAVGVFYSYAHRFWTVTDGRAKLVGIDSDDTLHLMAATWDPETETAIPLDSSISMRVLRDGELVADRPPWAMLSQTMGFHFGDNFALDDGSYTVEVDVGPLPAARRGALAGRFGDGGTAAVEFEFSQSARDELRFERFDDRAGERGALDPMEMEGMPLALAPEPEALPGTGLGAVERGDLVVAATVPDEEPYLAVSPRTRYNRYALPMLSLSATVERDGDAIFDDVLRAGIGPDLGYHYGATLDDVASGDEVTVTVDAPSNVSRHEGYETAFLDTPTASFTVP